MKLACSSLSACVSRAKRGDATRRGVALVVTLIMLAIITFLAVAFLALTNRERAAVTVTVDQTDTRLMVDAGFDRAQAEIVARMIGAGTTLGYDLLLSVNVDGFDITNGPLFTTLTNSSLRFDPRPPVFVRDPLNPTNLDFRFYIDLNRNGEFEQADGFAKLFGDPQWIGTLDLSSTNHHRTNRFVGRYAYLALPAGKSLDLNFIHNYAKRINNAMPADGFLRNHGYGNWELNLAGFLTDLNTNFWLYGPYVPGNLLSSSSGNAFQDAHEIVAYRYGTNLNSQLSFDAMYPLNLFGFTSHRADFQGDGIDGYSDGPNVGGTGTFFDLPGPGLPNDDTSQPWSGATNLNSLFSFEELVDANFSNRYPNFYAVLTSAMNPALPGSTPYDRTTLYRMLAQMGTDSAAANPPRIVPGGNLTLVGGLVRVALAEHGFTTNDYVRIINPATTNGGTFRITSVGANTFVCEPNPIVSSSVPPYLTGGPPTYYTVQRNNKVHLNYNNQNYHETNFVPWSATEFFLSAGDRILRELGALPPTNIVSATNIEIYPNNLYNAKTHQLLQIAANLWDALGTNSSLYPDFPTVFRPIFGTPDSGASVYITNWVVETNAAFRFAGTNLYVDINNPAARASLTPANPLYPSNIVYGQSFVVGAKKGYPNFNELALQTAVTIERKLELVKAATNQPPSQTNEMYLLGIGQGMGLEVWNSYSNTFPRPLGLELYYNVVMALTNTNGIIWPSTNNMAFPLRSPLVTNFTFTTNIAAGSWVGGQYPNSFRVPIQTNFLFIGYTTTNFGQVTTNLLVYTNGGTPGQSFIPSKTNKFERVASDPFFTPDWALVITNRILYFLIDQSVVPNRVVDVVNLTNTSRISILDLINRGAGLFAQGADPRRFWNPNRLAGPGSVTVGVNEQINASRSLTDPAWRPYQPSILVDSKSNMVSKFNAFIAGATGSNGTFDLRMETPFNPYFRLYQTASWQVNDPFVHYTATDLYETNQIVNVPPTSIGSLSRLNDKYSPWGGYRPVLGYPDSTRSDPIFDLNLAVKDPLIRWSEEWDFPTNHFGSVGWIGRVHRGTPWQTVYLKQLSIDTNEWARWSGRPDTMPTNDWRLVDLFTVAVDDNSQRALLSANQTNIAAWSALFSGVPALVSPGPFNSRTRLTPPPPATNVFIDAGTPQLGALYQGVQNARLAQPNQVFSNLSSFLSVPELSIGTNTSGASVASPFVNAALNDDQNGQTDAVYERLPQEILSLVSVEDTPRYAVYVWGQSLRPAERSLLTTAADFGLCTNYQITGEMAAKAILRVERRSDNRLHTVIESFQLLPNP